MKLEFSSNSDLRNFLGANDINLAYIENNSKLQLYVFENSILIEGEDINEDAFNKLLELSKERVLSNKDFTKILKIDNSAFEFPLVKISGKTENQRALIKALSNFPIVFISGPSGSGKTLLSVSYALNELMNKRIKKIIFLRNTVEANVSLGYLPGDLNQKLDPYMRAFYHTLEKLIGQVSMKKYIETNQIVLEGFSYLRGLTFDDSIIYIDEAQNTEEKDLKLALTRIGYNSKVIISADLDQKDRSNFNGYERALSRLIVLEETCLIKLDEKDVLRSALAKKIVNSFSKEI